MMLKLVYFMLFIILILIAYIMVSFIKRDLHVVCKDTLIITETGQCIFNKEGTGSCAVMLNDGSSARLKSTSVIGEKLIRCFRKDGSILYQRP